MLLMDSTFDLTATLVSLLIADASVWIAVSSAATRTYPCSDWRRGPVLADCWLVWPGRRWWGAGGWLWFWSSRILSTRLAPSARVCRCRPSWASSTPAPDTLRTPEQHHTQTGANQWELHIRFIIKEAMEVLARDVFLSNMLCDGRHLCGGGDAWWFSVDLLQTEAEALQQTTGRRS